MKIEDVKVVAVLGANGAMGQQIGMNVALAGRDHDYKVVMYGRRPEAMEKTKAGPISIWPAVLRRAASLRTWLTRSPPTSPTPPTWRRP